MSNDNISHFGNYEWMGEFWLPREKDKKLSGKVSYDPHKGIKIDLFTLIDRNSPMPDPDTQGIAEKIMHAAVRHGNDTTILTLHNVILNQSEFYGREDVALLSGWAEGLFINEYVLDDAFDAIFVEYDDYFNNAFFLVDKEGDAFKYTKGEKIILHSDFCIEIGQSYKASAIHNVDELLSNFFFKNKDDETKLKKLLDNSLGKGTAFFHQKKSTSSGTILRLPNSSVFELLEKESIWRNFWETLIDQPISIRKITLNKKTKELDGKVETSKSITYLSSLRRPEKIEAEAPNFHALPISSLNFGREKCLSKFKISISNWFRINDDPKWDFTREGLKRFLKAKEEIIDTTEYVSLISEIEAFLDIRGEIDTNLDKLISLYASDQWIENFKTDFSLCTSKETIGQWATNIRNMITHPKSLKNRRKNNEVFKDQIILQKVYAYVGGLLAKAILVYTTNLKEEDIEAYTMRVINDRKSYYKPTYL